MSDLNQNENINIQEDAFEIIACKMVAVVSKTPHDRR